MSKSKRIGRPLVAVADGIGAAIRRRRFRRGLTMDALAERLGVPAHRLREWERGRTRVPADALESIASAIGCEISDLLGATKKWKK